MSQKRARAERDQDPPAAPQAQAATQPQRPETPEPGEELAAEPLQQEDELTAARHEAELYKDRFLRAQAEQENFRKRSQREVEQARKYALERFAGDLLGVRDSLEMGLAASAEPGADLVQLKQGVELTQRMLVQVMERFGVEPVEPLGERFNPEFHEAMSSQESADQAANTVVAVMQKGYLLNGRVLRPAMVVVSKPPADAGA